MLRLLIILFLACDTHNDDCTASMCSVDTVEVDVTTGLSLSYCMSAANRSVLILNDEWEHVYFSTSSLNRQLAFLAHHIGFKVYMTSPPCKDYIVDGVEGFGIPITVGNNIYDKNEDCLQFCSACNFSAIENIENLEIIFGHVPVTSRAAISLKEKKFPNSRLFLFVSDIPEAMKEYQPQNYDDWEGLTIKAAEKADAVFSVGPKVFAFLNKILNASPKHINHFEYLPFPGEDFFEISMTLPGESTRVHILSYERMVGIRNLEAHNIFIAEAFSRTSNAYHDIAETLPYYIMKVPNQYHEVIENNVLRRLSTKDKYLDMRFQSYGTRDKNKQHLKQSNLVLLSSRSEAFGMPALEAMAAGVPVLMTANSGLAQFIRKAFPAESKQMIVNVGVNDKDREGDIEIWRNRIIDVLRHNYTARFDVAQSIKFQLKQSLLIKESRERLEKELNKDFK